jgi:glucan biosynthesis protein C
MISKSYTKINTWATPAVVTSTRLVFLDNLKVLMMIMVIVHHVGQAYGAAVGWWPIQEANRTRILNPFLMVNRSFGMSLFFMIAGYFTASTCDRKGPRNLVRSRLQRLGLPLVVYTIFMILLQVLIFGYLKTGELGPVWPIDVGHFWFVQHLLIYSLGYTGWRLLSRNTKKPTSSHENLPGYGSILIFALTLSIATAIVRTWFDIDEWIYLFGYLRIAPADLPRDLGLFLIGTLAYRKEWVNRFPIRIGWVCLKVGLCLAGLWYLVDLWLSGFLVVNDTVWGLLLPLWESLLCCCMCFGLIIVFRDNMNNQTPLVREMAQSTYTVYMIHIFVAIFFQYLFLGLSEPPLLKFFLVSLIAVPTTYLLATLIRRPLRL